MRACIAIAIASFLCLPAIPQESKNFKVEGGSLNAGGHPSDGVAPASPSYRLTLGAIGEGVAPLPLASASFGVGGGFASTYPPPGEVQDLRFADPATLEWHAETSAGTYSVYRDSSGMLTGGPFGACELTGIAGTTASDGSSPGPGTSWFYLVTASNLLGEEGSLGADGSGVQRIHPGPCP